MTYMTYTGHDARFTLARHVSHVSHQLMSHVLKYCMTYMTYILRTGPMRVGHDLHDLHRPAAGRMAACKTHLARGHPGRADGNGPAVTERSQTIFL